MTDPHIQTLATTFRAMKGNDLKVFWAMWILGASGVGNKAIKDLCGLSFPTVASCLVNLKFLGLITKTHRTDGWHITESGIQLLLPLDASTNFLHSESIINIDNPLTTKELKDINNNNNQPSERIFDSEILKALHQIGIYDPKAQDLASLDHMTQEYISSWAQALEEGLVGKGGSDIPLAIHLMGQNAPAPEPNKKGWEDYVTGEFSEFINH